MRGHLEDMYTWTIEQVIDAVPMLYVNHDSETLYYNRHTKNQRPKWMNGIQVLNDAPSRRARPIASCSARAASR